MKLKFYSLLEDRISKILVTEFSIKKLSDLTPETLRSIRDRIKQEITTLFENTNQDLSSPARIWLTDQFFKSIRISDSQMISDLVVIHEYELSDLTNSDISVLKNILFETKLFDKLKVEHDKRQTLS